MTQTRWIAAGIIVLVFIGGYFTYRHFVEEPPTWLINLVAKQEPAPPLPPGDLAPFMAPEGFVATIYSREAPGARVLGRDSRGTMVASLTKEGKIVALPDENGDGRADSVDVIIEGLNQPHGFLFKCDSPSSCFLYVGETDGLVRYPYRPDTRTVGEREELLALPSGKGHSTRTLLEHPDGERFLVSVGSSCNVCNETEPYRATILSYVSDSNTASVYASGLRNSVFMATNYVTGAIWATDNGRDLIGNDIPPDELNIIEEGKHYGWPYCYGKNVYDEDFDAGDGSCAYTPSAHDLQAHSAALGLAFIPEEGWPEEYRSDLLVAYHGSWNRTVPTGYKVVRFDMSPDGKSITGGPYDFLTGFLLTDDEEDALGRPVGLYAEPGGTVYVSDDHAGAVYKVSVTGIP